MIRETLPENPKERKAIILLCDVDIVRSFEMEWIKSPNITVLEYPFDNDSPIYDNELYKKLKEEDLIELGAILSQSPYNLDTYADAKKFEDLILFNAKKKYDIFVKFCEILGATKIHIEHSESERNTTNKKFGGVGGGGTSYATAEAKFEKDETLESYIKQHYKFKGIYDGNPNPDIEEAEKLLNDNHLFKNETFTSLLEARKNNKNKMIARDVFFSYTSESKKCLKILGGIKLNFPGYSFNVDGNYTNKVDNLSNMEVHLEVEFGKG